MGNFGAVYRGTTSFCSTLMICVLIVNGLIIMMFHFVII